MPRKQIIGLISDTHGLLRPEAFEALKGSDVILHAGDIGSPDIIPELERLAPVIAVRGNVDTRPWAQAIPETQVVEADGATRLYMLHSIDDLNFDPTTAGFHAVIFGHSHKPGFHWKDGVLYINPGSAGPRRFSLPITVGRLTVEQGELSVEIIELTLRSATR